MQNTTLDNNVYFLLLLGMVAVGAHAYSLFNQPIDRPSASTRWRFLSTIPIQLATTQSRFRLGLVLYIVVFELIYLVLASSSSLLLMTYQMSGRQELTGALSEAVSPSGTVPILASTAIILLTQIRPLSQVELILRRFAHRMARVPDGLKDVKERASKHLRKADWPTQGLSADDLAGTYALADLRTGIDLQRSQAITAWLFENTLGTRGSLSWDEEGSEQLVQLFNPLKYEVMQLRSDILEAGKPTKSQKKKSLKSSVSEAYSQGPWQELLSRSKHLEERLTLLMCLLLINQPDIDTKDDHELKQLIDSTRRREQSEVSDIAIKSCVVGAIVCVSVLFLYQWGDTLLRQELRQSPYSAKAPFGEYLDARIDSNTELAELYPFQGLTTGEQQELIISGSIQSDLNDAFEDTLWTAITFFCTVFVVLSMNAHNIQVWRPGSHEKKSESVTPSVHYALIAISASVTAATVLFTYLFITEALMPALQKNVDVLSFEIMRPFSSMLPTVLQYSLAAGVCAVFIIWLDGIFAARPPAATGKAVVKSKPALVNRILMKLSGISSRILSKMRISGLPATPRQPDVKTRSTLRGHILTKLISALSQLASSIRITLAPAAAIAFLVLAIFIGTGQSIDFLEVFDRLATTFVAFLCFLAILVLFMQSHPQRYTSLPPPPRSGEDTPSRRASLPAPVPPPPAKVATHNERGRTEDEPGPAGR